MPSRDRVLNENRIDARDQGFSNNVASKESPAPSLIKGFCAPQALQASNVFQLQKTLGNRAVYHLLNPMQSTVQNTVQLCKDKEKVKTKKELYKEKRKETKAKKFIESDDDRLNPKLVAEKWEDYHDLLQSMATSDSLGVPTGATAGEADILVLDLTEKTEHGKLFSILQGAVTKSLSDGPKMPHDNTEQKLPIYPQGTLTPTGKAPYEEYNFLKKGGRLVKDNMNNLVYICLHYSIFVRVVYN